jgi:hypothetical protein
MRVVPVRASCGLMARVACRSLVLGGMGRGVRGPALVGVDGLGVCAWPLVDVFGVLSMVAVLVLCVACWKARENSVMDGKRSLGVFATARRMTASRAGGMHGLSVLGG